MIRLRTGTVVAVRGTRPGVMELEVTVDGRREAAIAYPDLTGPVDAGDEVLLNTTAVSEGLGTGGFHFVIGVAGQADRDPSAPGHVMKLRYTPQQLKVLSVEEPASPHRQAMEAAEGLDGLPVIWLPLHSMLGAACAGARRAGAERIVHVMTDGASLPMAFSRQIPDLRRAELLDEVITCGQAFGGDLEAVSVFSGLLAATAAAGADVAVVGDGPGSVGTATRWGESAVAGGMSLNAAAILGGRPVAALRLSFAEPRPRHHGLSSHSITVLTRVTQSSVHVAVPTLEGEQREAVWNALRAAGLEERHQVVEVPGEPALDLLAERDIEPSTMGRGLREDREFFLAAGAAGVLAGRMAAGSARYRQEVVK
ncbi:MAG TPA: DUF3866 family protein [Actinomycetota bacterium]|nr:DUF3866 family protein [Actinomycetota bacterium]